MMTTISGAMSRAAQRVHIFSCGFMCVLFAGLAFLSLQQLLLQTETPANFARTAFSFGFLIFVVWAINMQIRFQHTIVCEFSYDGYTLEFRTIGVRRTQVRQTSGIKTIREWRGRGGPQGYRIDFREGGRIYLSYSVRNAGL